MRRAEVGESEYGVIVLESKPLVTKPLVTKEVSKCVHGDSISVSYVRPNGMHNLDFGVEDDDT